MSTPPDPHLSTWAGPHSPSQPSPLAHNPTANPHAGRPGSVAAVPPSASSASLASAFPSTASHLATLQNATLQQAISQARPQTPCPSTRLACHNVSTPRTNAVAPLVPATLTLTLCPPLRAFLSCRAVPCGALPFMQMRDTTRKVAEYLVNVSQCPVEAIEEALADAHSKQAAAAGTGVEHMFAEVRLCVCVIRGACLEATIIVVRPLPRWRLYL